MEDTKTVQEIVDILDTVKDQKQVETIKEIGSADLLRSKVSGFIVEEMEAIKGQNAIKDIIVRELMNNIALHKLNTQELLEAYDVISKHKTVGTSALLKPFEQVSNASSTLVPPKKPDDDLAETGLKNIDSKTMTTLFLLYNKMAKAMKEIPEGEKESEASE